MSRIGFVINPIAGMGGRVGLKGTDDVVEQAIALGARPVAPGKALETLTALGKLIDQASRPVQLRWLTAAGGMGAEALRKAGFEEVEIAFQAKEQTTADDTRVAVQRFVEAGIDLILFCGGDGTARDICDAVGGNVPILGIPSGVKMYSGVFGTSPARTAEILLGFLEGRLSPSEADVVDLDEEKYRRNEWAVRLYHSALTPYEPTYTQSAKMLISETTDAEIKQEIAGHLLEGIEAAPDTLYLLGAGSTVRTVGELLEIDKTLLGIDAVAGGTQIGKDLNEKEILALLDRYAACKLILSPIGAQGFVLGRGNLQISPQIIRRIGPDNIIVIATPAKLARTPALRFDTGDASLDAELTGSGYVAVVIGYRLRRLMKTAV